MKRIVRKRIKEEAMQVTSRNASGSGMTKSSQACESTIQKFGPKFSLFVALICCSMFIQLSEQLSFTAIQIPALVQRGTHFWLSCQFELAQQQKHSSADQLYSVKWYKNNEEFYRLQMADGQTSDGQQQQQQQQQHFPQAGVNVMMSSSNATHVRLLNASLETEGLFACEISTQNLSTIRYEKEIRVYVLPHSRLNIVGFKGRYSLGDKVDLICASDFSRPKPALAWFINGKRIGQSSRWFELDSQRKSKLNEPTLVKLSLGLKFKLSPELVSALLMLSGRHHNSYSNSSSGSGSGSGNGYTSAGQLGPTETTLAVSNGSSNQRNQSHYKRRQQTQQTPTARQAEQQHPPPLPYQLQDKFELKLQCKYKLAEISDVTFNELLARQVASSKSDRKRETEAESEQVFASASSSSSSSSWLSLGDESGPVGWMRAPRALTKFERQQRFVSLTKSAIENQIIQGKCPAERSALLEALALRQQSQVSRADPCRLGSLELTSDDPLIAFGDSSLPTADVTSGGQNDADPSDVGEPAEEEEQQQQTNRTTLTKTKPSAPNEDSKRRRRQLEPNEYSIGDSISVDCLTIGALMSNTLPVQHDTHQLEDNFLERARHGALAQKSSTRIGGHCSDFGTRRKALISGKTNEDHWAGPSLSSQRVSGTRTFGLATQARREQQQQQQQQLSGSGNNNNIHVAYLSLTAAAAASPSTTTDQDPDAWQWATSRPQEHGTNTRTLGQNHKNGPADSTDSVDDWPASGLAHMGLLEDTGGAPEAVPVSPPLLEWFINNQEAPKSSARYAPELPILQAPSSGRLGGAESGDTANRGMRPRTLVGAASRYTTLATIPMDEGDLVHQLAGVAEASSEVLPSIDYAEYFANFISRPISQQLSLNLTLDKQHFMTPDSTLRLRCSSTQAQILAAETANLLIVATNQPFNSTTTNYNYNGWQQRPKNQIRKLKAGSNSQALSGNSSKQPRSGATSYRPRAYSSNLTCISIIVSLVIMTHVERTKLYGVSHLDFLSSQRNL